MNAESRSLPRERDFFVSSVMRSSPIQSQKKGARLRKFIFGFAIPVLSSCLFTVDHTPPTLPLAGTYHGDHGVMTRTYGLESELILDGNGTFRYFLIDSNTAFYTSKGRWKATENDMVWTGVARSYLYHGSFRMWDTGAIPDTSFLRNVSDSGFERLEVTYDTLFISVLRWVGYRLISPEQPLPEGTFEFKETYPDGVDPTLTVTGLTRLELTRNGRYTQQVFRNGVLNMEDVDTLWTQAGTHLITAGNRHCEFEPGYTSCSDAPSDYEYVARLSNVGDTAFYLWMAPSFTYQPSPFWAAFQRAP